ncbi:MAG TPA: hypothetical protein VFE96_07490, partial [Candidatus Bathyarchaeia archaeon]|nr:hypothetical protein [Candidatus Bathyarchaeia archaeon]
MLDSDRVRIGFLVVVAGWGFQTAASGFGGASPLLQLLGTLFVITGVAIAAVAIFRFMRRIEKHI